MSFERRSARLFFAVLLVIVTFVAVFGRRLLRASEGGDKHDTLDIDGLTRNYFVHIRLPTIVKFPYRSSSYSTVPRKVPTARSACPG
jgi:hypothetical protein